METAAIAFPVLVHAQCVFLPSRVTVRVPRLQTYTRLQSRGEKPTA